MNITYKILYNGTVAMTGGQDPFGQLDVLSLVKVLQAEGVRQIIITTDELSNYRLARETLLDRLGALNIYALKENGPPGPFASRDRPEDP